MLSFSHVSVKTSTQQLLTVRFADLSSRMSSILLSSDRTLARRMDGMAGLVGLAASLARIPPRLPLFCFLAHRFRRLLSGGGVAGGSGVVAGRRSNPSSFSVSVAWSKTSQNLLLQMSSKACLLYLYIDVVRRDEHVKLSDKHVLNEQNTARLGQREVAACARAAIQERELQATCKPTSLRAC